MQTFKQYLNEVGDSNRPYSYQFTKILGNEKIPSFYGIATFKADDKNFWINFLTRYDNRNEEYFTNVDFESRRGYAQTNLGIEQAFRIMATVIAATKEYLKTINEKYSVKTAVLHVDAASSIIPGQKNKSTQKMKLYLAFIKKNLKYVTIERSNDVSAQLKIKDSFYK